MIKSAIVFTLMTTLALQAAVLDAPTAHAGSLNGDGGSCTTGGICLEVTLALDNGDPNQCGTADTLDVNVGDQVNFCYTVSNDSGIELDYQSLMDDVDGSILDVTNIPLGDQASIQYNRIVTAGSSETVTSTWDSRDSLPGYLPTVTTGGGGITDRVFCDGFDGAPCDNGGGSDFVDITAIGTALGLSDDGNVAVTLPFPFTFYGQTSSDICIGNNGGAVFGRTSCFVGYDNSELPAQGLFAAILPLWDDFDDETGDVYIATIGSAPNRQFIVEWFDRLHYDGAVNTDSATFEFILNESGSVQFEYADVDYMSGLEGDGTGGATATIGMQESNFIANNQFSFNTASVTSGSGIDWTPTVPQIFSDTDTVTLNVGAPEIAVSPNPLSGTAPAGGTSMATLNIGNNGDRDLDWTSGEAAPDTHFPPPGTRFAMPLGDPAEASAQSAISRIDTGSRKPQANVQVPFGSGATVPAFGQDLAGSSNDFVSFDAIAPLTLNVIRSNDYELYAGDFVDGDFSRLYALDGNSLSPHFNAFVSVDTTSGIVTDIANVPPAAGETWTGLSFDSTNGVIYASSVNCGTDSQLYTLVPGTGAAVSVGTIDAPCIIDIAVSPAGLLYGVDIVDDALYAIDKTTGASSLIGSLGFNAQFAQSMDFDDSTGILYLAGYDGDASRGYMYTVDTSTGAATLISPIGSTNGEIGAMGVATLGTGCSQPEDLPWVSLLPTSGTTLPGNTDAVTVTFDATDQNAGDVLNGTLCISSNDPHNRRVSVPIELTVN